MNALTSTLWDVVTLTHAHFHYSYCSRSAHLSCRAGTDDTSCHEEHECTPVCERASVFELICSHGVIRFQKSCSLCTFVCIQWHVHCYCCSSLGYRWHSTQIQNERLTQPDNSNKWATSFHLTFLMVSRHLALLIHGERRAESEQLVRTDITEDGRGFAIQMTDDKDFTSTRLEVRETRRPFQTTVTLLLLNAHLSYFADSTFKWHRSASAWEILLRRTFVMSHTSVSHFYLYLQVCFFSYLTPLLPVINEL